VVSSVSGMSPSENNYSSQVSNAPAFSPMEVIEQESIFGKKGTGEQYVDDMSIFTQSSYESYSDNNSVFSNNSGVEM